MSEGPKVRFAAVDGGDDVVIDLLASADGEQSIRTILRSASVEQVCLGMLDLAGSPRSSGEDRQHTKRLVELTTSVPPIVVHRSSMRVVDGVHRVQAFRQLDRLEIHAQLFDGDDEAAFLLGVKLNIDHGLPLTRDDRRAAADQLLRGHPEWSDRIIASVVGISDKTVAAQRKRSTADSPQLTRRIGRDGKLRPVGPGNVRRTTRLLPDGLGASTQDVVRTAGFATGVAPHKAPCTPLSGESSVPTGDQQRRPPTVRRGPTNMTVTAASIIAQLRNDPSFRHTNAGRIVMRAFALEAVSVESDIRLVDSLPAHLLVAIANLAEMRARALQIFANRLRQRWSRI